MNPEHRGSAYSAGSQTAKRAFLISGLSMPAPIQASTRPSVLQQSPSSRSAASTVESQKVGT